MQHWTAWLLFSVINGAEIHIIREFCSLLGPENFGAMQFTFTGIHPHLWRYNISVFMSSPSWTSADIISLMFHNLSIVLNEAATFFTIAREPKGAGPTLFLIKDIQVQALDLQLSRNIISSPHFFFVWGLRRHEGQLAGWEKWRTSALCISRSCMCAGNESTSMPHH